jgi:hypothetical protein
MAIVIFVALLFLQTLPRVQSYVTLLCTAMLLVMAVEGVFNGRRITKAVREKFPKEEIRGGSLGWYAFVRASQVRKLRAPRPRVKPGEPIPN